MPPLRPRVYLASPNVFLPEAEQHFAVLPAVCETLGLEASPPSDDGAAAAGLEGPALARAIHTTNMGLLTEAQGVIADLSPFRGTEPDSGTVFEVGVAVALGLPAVAYGTPPGTYVERVGATLGVAYDEAGKARDPAGFAVEDLGLPLNLMLACSVEFAESAEKALQVLADLLAQRRAETTPTPPSDA